MNRLERQIACLVEVNTRIEKGSPALRRYVRELMWTADGSEATDLA
jgi:hypothetical protein